MENSRAFLNGEEKLFLFYDFPVYNVWQRATIQIGTFAASDECKTSDQ
jgi:hypothetical protein